MLKEASSLFRTAFAQWRQDDALQWSAALAYYAALAVAPLLVLLLAIVGLVWQGPEAQQRLMDLIARNAGEQATQVARMVLSSEDDSGSGILASVVSTALLLVGASGLFGGLRKALNDLWDVEPIDEGLGDMIRARALGLAVVAGLGAVLLAGVVVQALLSGIAGQTWMSVLNQIGSVALFTLVFAAVFRMMPDADIGWREVWIGAAATAVLFTLGQLLVGLYLGRSSVGSRYGAAGTLLAFLVWLYYSSAVFLFGAESTQVWARRYGTALAPEAGARRTGRRGGRGRESQRVDPERTRVRGEASYP